MVVVIVGCAAFNSYEEELPSLALYIVTVLAAPAPSLVGAAAFALVSYFRRCIDVWFCIAAYVVCGTGVVAYLFYALNGKADSLHTAGHMHVIMFPMLHAALALMALCVAGVMSVAQLALRRWARARTRRGTER